LDGNRTRFVGLSSMAWCWIDDERNKWEEFALHEFSGMAHLGSVGIGNVGTPECMNQWGAGFGRGLSQRLTTTAASNARNGTPLPGEVFTRVHY
jgi:hypothetical protein